MRTRIRAHRQRCTTKQGAYLTDLLMQLEVAGSKQAITAPLARHVSAAQRELDSARSSDIQSAICTVI
jgi:hypothetical protein